MDILVVEDDPNLSALWGAVLSEQGETPDLEASANGARLRLSEKRYDLVLLDLSLGNEDGLGLARLATVNNPAAKVVIITGSAVRGSDDLFAAADEVIAVLRKPVDIEILMSLCAELRTGGDLGAAVEETRGSIEFRPLKAG